MRKSIWYLLSLLLISSMVLAACGTPTEAPAAEEPAAEEPVATE